MVAVGIYLLTTKQTHLNVAPLLSASRCYLDRALPSPPTQPPEPSDPDPASEPRARRSHSERREEAERRILDAAVQIVAERGLQELTLAECGQAAGYSRGLAAHYFGSREELIGSIARYIVDEYAKRRTVTVRQMSSSPGLEDLLNRVSFYIMSSRDTPSHTRAFHAVLGQAFKEAPLATAIAELNRNSIAAWATPIREAMQAGEIRTDIDATRQAALIVATVRGVVRQWLVDPTVDLDLMGQELIGNLRRGLAR